MGNKASSLPEAAEAGDIRNRLHAASEAGDIATVKQLVQRGADKEAKDRDGKTVLMRAAYWGHLDMVRYLVEQGADKEAQSKYGWTVLICAAEEGHLEVVLYLVEQGANSMTALATAIQDGDLSQVRLLLDNGVGIDTKYENGETALIWAGLLGLLGVVRYLVEQGADKEAKDGDGKTALMRAAFAGHLEVVRYLVEQGADKDAKGKGGLAVLICAAEEGHLQVVQYLVEQDADGMTALVKAIQDDSLYQVRILLDGGVDINTKNEERHTALIVAAGLGKLNIVEHLVGRGANAGLLDNEENSVLVLLLQGADADEDNILPIAKLLLEHGAPPLKSNKQGQSARSIARKKSFRDVIDLLDEYAFKPQPESERENPKWLISHDDIMKTRTVLAEGSFGTVHRAKWAHTDVVVKEITVVEMRQFLKEVKTWRELTHLNVVRFFGANHQKEPFFIVSEYASNGELTTYLKREKENGRAVTWQKLKEVAAGLSYLHAKRIVHGDLKGNNIVVSGNGTAMLTDFGLSFTESGSCSVKKRKDRLGAMAWRAPEFAKMTVETPTRKSDVFSLGMCIIEAVTCKDPWNDTYSNEEIRGFLRNGEIKVERPQSMTDDQWELVQQMIAVSPDDRPDVADVLSALEGFARTERRQAVRQAALA